MSATVQGRDSMRNSGMSFISSAINAIHGNVLQNVLESAVETLKDLCSSTLPANQFLPMQVAIMTANGKTLAPMHDLITKWCGVDVTDNRYVIVGCEDVPGFEAVERGEKVDVVRVQPGIVDLMKQTIAEYPGSFHVFVGCR